MSVSRGKFLKSLGKSLPGLVLGGGIGTAAQTLLGKIAAVSGGAGQPVPVAKNERAPVIPAQNDFINNGPATGNHVALTFDDGPTPGVTEIILDELKQRQLQATFFMIGQKLAAAPELARRVLAEGHDLGNHTFTHPKLTDLSPSQVEEEINKTQEVMGEILQHKPAWFRPPYGELRPNQSGLVQRAGLRIVLWSVDPSDWSQPGEAKITETILREARPGAIIVCHDLFAQTAKSIGPILDGLLERGFVPSKLSNFLK